jgi:multiple sugar transport system permease protein
MAALSLRQAERRLAWLLLLPAFAAVALLVAWPIYVVVQMSLRPTRLLALDQLMSQPLGWGNFDRVCTSRRPGRRSCTRVFYTIGTLIPAFPVRDCSSRCCSIASFRHGGGSVVLLLLPWAVPGVIVSITFLWMLDASYGVVNSVLRRAELLSTDLAWFVNADTGDVRGHLADRVEELPFFAITILAALQAIPAELYEAAKVDGARAWHQFRYVTWPSIKRPAMLAVLLNALWTFREFDIIYASTGGGPRGDLRRSGSWSIARRLAASDSAPRRRSAC